MTVYSTATVGTDGTDGTDTTPVVPVRPSVPAPEPEPEPDPAPAATPVPVGSVVLRTERDEYADPPRSRTRVLLVAYVDETTAYGVTLGYLDQSAAIPLVDLNPARG